MKLSERIQSLFFRGTKIRHPAYALLSVMLVLAGCQTIASVPESSAESCLDKITRHVRKLPPKQVLNTLDGQDVNLQEFFDKCAQDWSHCALYSKFYYWKNEVKTIKSKSEMGIVEHKIRMYYNPLSICHPEKVDTGRTHGDVAEFYDSEGIFMGLGVYMGKGLYYSLPYSKYKHNKKPFL